MKPPVRSSKYGAKPSVVDGIRFDSKAEARRWGILTTLERAGKIAELGRQRKFRCEVNGRLICTYAADFDYLRDGELIIEDVKGCQTQAFKLKRKLVEALHGVTITIIPA